LFKYDIFGSLVPDLAESWEIQEDGLVYQIKIKEGITWSDGTPITTDDLIYTAFKIPDLQVVITDKVDSRTIRYTLPNKYSPFLSLLTNPVMKNNTEENDDPLMPISSGEYKIVNISKDGPITKSVTLATEKNEQIKKLTFRYYSNDDELLTGAKLGEIDGFILNDQIKLQNFELYRFPTQGVYYSLIFNLRNENVENAEFRKKMQQVLDIEDLIAPYGILAQGPISRNLYTDGAINFNPYDKDILEDIPINPVTITVPNITQHKQLAERIKDAWEDKLGLVVEIQKVDPERIQDTIIVNRDFEILLYGQETGRDPDRYAYWHSTQKDYPGLNLSGFEQVRADRSLEEGRNVIESTTRRVHYGEFQNAIMENTPAIFLYHPYQNYYVTKRISGIGDKYTFNLADRFLDFENWRFLDL
ncbi:ABC transporter substrate-binding protein, partial [candidate division WWE3 bacterium]|nr:ABC transporter substrate-binding protein [candidate division WWE3 bacterium]